MPYRRLPRARWIVLPGMFSALVMPTLADPQPANVAPVPTLHAETRVVQIDVVVTDSKGQAVAGLLKADFAVTDKGKPRTIDIFSVGDGQPAKTMMPLPPSLPPNVFSNRNETPVLAPAHATLIVLDASPANPRFELAAFRAAKGQAIGRVLSMRPDEQIAVYVVSKQEGLLLLQNYTSDRGLLLTKLRTYMPRGLYANLSPWDVWEPVSQEYKQDSELRAPPPKPPRPLAPGESPRRDPTLTPARETEYRIDNAVRENRLSLQTVAERLALLPGRKNIFWATAGIPPMLMNSPGWDHTITALNEANVAVNTGGCSDSSRDIAERTGGSATCIDAPGASTVIEAARTTYTLGFYLADNERDDAYHALKVRVDRPHVQLFYRQGYYAGSTQDSLHERKPELETSLLNPADSTAVGITARVETIPGTPRGTVTILLNLDPATLSLKEQTGRWTGNAEEEVVETNENGNTLAKISDKKEFEVAKENRAQFDRDGVAWPFSIPLIQGATKITVLMRDTKTGHVGSLTVPLK